MPEHLTIPEAAKYLRVSKRTMDRWRSQGIGPAWTRVGHRVIYQRRDLEDYLDRHRVQPVREVAA